jgi:hypothetical protein
MVDRYLKYTFVFRVKNYLNPDQANAPSPTANVRQVIDATSDVEFAAKHMKIV